MKRRPANQLLQQLPPRSLKRLAGDGIELYAGKELIAPGERPSIVYFPLSAVLMHVQYLADGSRIAVGLVGYEGFAPVAAVAPGAVAHTALEVQSSGMCLVAAIAVFAKMMDDDPAFRRTMLTYVATHDNNRAQLAACNRRHESVRRLARWLLMTNDRTGNAQIAVSQQYLADALGVSRQVANAAVSELRRAHCIEIVRNEITIVDRPCLERESCECYRRLELKAA
jgi:CRP-like cAMP-binding protein